MPSYPPLIRSVCYSSTLSTGKGEQIFPVLRLFSVKQNPLQCRRHSACVCLCTSSAQTKVSSFLNTLMKVFKINAVKCSQMCLDKGRKKKKMWLHIDKLMTVECLLEGDKKGEKQRTMVERERCSRFWTFYCNVFKLMQRLVESDETYRKSRNVTAVSGWKGTRCRQWELWGGFTKNQLSCKCVTVACLHCLTSYSGNVIRLRSFLHMSLEFMLHEPNEPQHTQSREFSGQQRAHWVRL